MTTRRIYRPMSAVISHLLRSLLRRHVRVISGVPMFLDKTLAGLSIRSKVFIFVLPLVGGIVGLSAINYYAGSMLSQRIGGANASIASLSGFKEAYAEMNGFLSSATEESRDAVVARLDAQIATMQDSIVYAATREEADALHAAQDIAVGLKAETGKLWQLHQQEAQARAAIETDIGTLATTKTRLSEEADKLMRAAMHDEKAATDLLNAASRYSNAASEIEADAAELDEAITAQDVLGIIGKRKRDLVKIQRKLVRALPEEQAGLANALDSAIKDILAIGKSKTPTDAAVAEVKMHARSLLLAGARLRDLSQQSASAASKRFAEIEKPIRRARAISAAAQDLIETIQRVQFATVRLLGRGDGKTKAALADEVSLLGKQVVTFGLTASDEKAITSLVDEILPGLATLQANSETLVDVVETRRQAFDKAASRIDDAWLNIISFADSQSSNAVGVQDKARGISISAAAVFSLFGACAAILLITALKGPIGRLTDAMRDVASGNLETDISGTERGDEIGEMARALGVFKSNAADKVRLEQEGREARERAAREREASDRQKAEAERQLRDAIGAIADGLGRLARGDLTRTIDTAFPGELDTLRRDFNESMLKMRETLARIRENAQTIQANSDQLRSSADEQSRRTESQAASLEETAAAVEQVSSTVSMSSARTQETEKLAFETRQDASDSSVIVTDAVEAMGRIEKASHEIGTIIGVIDEIAFQTNLLALNAGVEAARAGEAGHGFAVVAQEVRELAGRSASAAREIKELIGRSGKEVQSGVRLVGETGESIARIAARIDEIGGHLEVMAKAGVEQATSLREVSSTVNQIDRATQQNAAMAEETNAATHNLAEEAGILFDLVAAFRLDSDERYVDAA